jgi:ArsR family transcriptional regulator
MEVSTEQLLAQFKALADPIRLRLVALCRQAECHVSELARVTSQSQPRISQHLKQLCQAQLLERFRDGHYVYYRVPARSGHSAIRRRLLGLIPADEPQLQRDLERLRGLRDTGTAAGRSSAEDVAERRLYRALVELTVARPLGDVIDIGCGQGRLLKVLASRANRAVGVDIDAEAREHARAELLLAGAENCSLRKGNMYELPFSDGEFDSVILDDVLNDAERPTDALLEARRLLHPGGRLLILAATVGYDIEAQKSHFASWCSAANLRLAPPRAIPGREPRWLLAVATIADHETAVA